MAKRDPLGEVKSPINSKLAAEIARTAIDTAVASVALVETSDASAPAAPPPPISTATVRSDLRAGGEPSIEPISRTIRATGGRVTRFKQVKRTPEELEACNESLRILSKVFGIGVQHGEVDRALWSLLGRAEESIEQLERSAPKLVRPHTSDTDAKIEMEDAIANFLLKALSHYDAS